MSDRPLTPVTVLMGVGPEPRHSAYLLEAIKSVADQTVMPDEVLVIDDMAGLDGCDPLAMLRGRVENLRVWSPPWNLGSVGALNCGVGLARNDAIIILSSDDWLDSGVVEQCQKVYQPDKLAYYWFDIQLHGMSDERMALPSGASMVTKKLWRHTGGVPIEACVGHPDSIFMSVLTVRCPEVELVHAHALYHARILEENDYYIRLRGGWNGTIDAVKNMCTSSWKPPVWGRMP